MVQQPVNYYLDHAVLKPELSREDAEAAIKLGIQFGVRTVCVRPSDIEVAVRLCKGSETKVCTVLAFPHGVNPTTLKALEAKTYIDLGVKEIDMVANYGWIKSGMWDEVQQDIQAVAEITRHRGVILKVIFETSMLTLEEIDRTTRICVECGADFVKTSTGFNGGGATVEAVTAMLEAAQGFIQVKASGGIRDREAVERFIAMGCTRLGVNYSSTPVICGDTGSIAADKDGY